MPNFSPERTYCDPSAAWADDLTRRMMVGAEAALLAIDQEAYELSKAEHDRLFDLAEMALETGFRRAESHLNLGFAAIIGRLDSFIENGNGQPRPQDRVIHELQPRLTSTPVFAVEEPEV